MNPTNIFPNWFWRGSYPGDLEPLKQRALFLLNHSNNLNSHVERDGGFSSSSDRDAPHYWEETRDFINWLEQYNDEIWKSWGYPLFPRRMGASWVNLHPTGGWTDEHVHKRVPQVVVLYIDQPENGGNLEIFDPMFHTWVHGYRDAGPWIEIPVKTGDVLSFPGWVYHRTQKNQSDRDRIVMSINVCS